MISIKANNHTVFRAYMKYLKKWELIIFGIIASHS